MEFYHSNGALVGELDVDRSSDGHCLVCKKQSGQAVPVFTFDNSNGEYQPIAICLRCLVQYVESVMGGIAASM